MLRKYTFKIQIYIISMRFIIRKLNSRLLYINIYHIHVAHVSSGQITRIKHVSKHMSFTLDVWQNTHYILRKCWFLIVPVARMILHTRSGVSREGKGNKFLLSLGPSYYWISSICRATSSLVQLHLSCHCFAFYTLYLSRLLHPGGGALARNINLRGSGNSLLDLAPRSLRPK